MSILPTSNTCASVLENRFYRGVVKYAFNYQDHFSGKKGGRGEGVVVDAWLGMAHCGGSDVPYPRKKFCEVENK